MNCLDESVFMAVPEPKLTKFGIHHSLESCALSEQWFGYGKGRKNRTHLEHA